MGKHNELHDPLGPTHTCDLTCACLRQIRPQKQAFQQAIHPDDPFTHRVETGCAAGRCVEAIISNMNATSTFLRDKRILFNVRLTVHLETSSSKLSMRKSCISSRYIYGSSSKSLARAYISVHMTNKSRDQTRSVNESNIPLMPQLTPNEVYQVPWSSAQPLSQSYCKERSSGGCMKQNNQSRPQWQCDPSYLPQISQE